MSYEGELKSGDVIGRRLIAVLQSDTEERTHVNLVTTFYRLDSDVTFALPFENAGRLRAEIPPPGCHECQFEQLKPVLGQQIVAVLWPGPDMEAWSDSPYLLLENGYLLTDVMGDSPGTSGEGLYIFGPGEVDVGKLVDFFK